jgi:hypothetical protein
MAMTAWLVIASPGRSSAATVVPADGQPWSAQLTAADARWQLVFTAGGRERHVPAAELVRWGDFAEPDRGPIVVLADGGLLAAEATGIDKENLAAESDLLGAVKIPLESLAGVLFHPPADRPRRERLLGRIARAAGRSDRLILDNGDEITGMVDSLENDTLHITADVGRLDVATRRIVALVFSPAVKRARPGAGFRAWVGLSDGSRLLAGKILLAGDSLELSAAGQTWKTAAKELVALQPLGSRAAYLSDMKPSEYRYVPYLNLPWPYHDDRNVTDGLLRCGGRLFVKGLGVHSAARLTYALDQPYRRFQAELGIDDSTAGRGSVLFRVFVDGRQRYASGPVRGGAAPLPVSIDLAGAKRLDLVVDYGERGDVLDHADWLDARLIK